MADHEFNVAYEIFDTIDPAYDNDFDQTNENDGNRCGIPVEQLQPIHSTLQREWTISNTTVICWAETKCITRVMNIVDAHHITKHVKSVNQPFDFL